MKIGQKLNKETFFWLFIFIAAVCFAWLIANLKNHFIYPDSYLYVLTAKTGSFFKTDLVNLNFHNPVDYFTLLKPLTSLSVYLLYLSNINITLLNTLFIAAGFLLVYKSSEKKHSLNFLAIVFTAFALNGNTIYWLSRYSSEFISILILSLTIYFGQKKKFKFYTFAFTILCLLRFEFIFIFPILNLLCKVPKKLAYGFYLFTIAFALLIAIISSNISYFLTHILLPLTSILIFIQILNLNSIKTFIDKYFKKLKMLTLILYLGFFIVLSLVGLGISTELGIDGGLSGFSKISLLMMGLILIYLFFLNLDWSKKQVLILFSILVLGVIYTWTAPDTFRYWLYISPLLLFSILLNEHKYPKIINIFFGLILILQGVILVFILPWPLLKENYWMDRLSILNDYKADYLIYNSTPLTASLAGFKSEDICSFDNNLPEKAIFVIDDLSIYRCKEKMQTIRKLSGNMQYLGNYGTREIVEFNRYTSYGQNSQNYKLN